MKKRRMLSVLALLLVFALTFSSCALMQGGNDDDTGPIRIGLLHEGSGPFQTWGLQEYRGFMVGLMYATNGTMEINGRPIEVIVEDTTGDVGVAMQRATALLEDHNVHVLAGSNLSSIALAVMHRAEEVGTPYVISGAAADEITGANWNQYTFRIGRNLWMASQAGLGFLEHVGGGIAGTTWVIISPDFAGGRSGSEALQNTIVQMGGEVLELIFPPMDAMDFTPHILRIIEMQPDFITATLVGNNYIVILPQQLQDMGALEHSMLTTSLVDFDFLATVGQAGIGMTGETIYHYNLFDTPANRFLIEKHQEMFNGDMPDYWSGQSFAGAQAIVEALRIAGTTDPYDFIDAMRGLEFYSVKGRMIIRPEDHQALQGMAIGTIVDDGAGGVTIELAAFMPLEDLIPPITVPNR